MSAGARCSNLRATAGFYYVNADIKLSQDDSQSTSASVAQPQDLTSAINANPGTLSQFKGTQFVIGGAWAGATYDLTQTGNIGLPASPLITPFSAKSQTPGSAIPNVGVTQQMEAFGMPVTLGLGLLSAAGAGTDFRKQPASNGTSTYLTILEFASSNQRG